MNYTNTTWIDDRFFKLLEIESCSCEYTQMQDYIFKFVDDLQKNESIEGKRIFIDCDFEGNIYITKFPLSKNNNREFPTIKYPCIVAHLDTVHKITGDGIFPVEINGKVTGINPVTMKQTGIGGDDKCGIWAALMLLEKLDYCKIAFFIDEEIGCVGSKAADMFFFRNCRFILQADRRGNSDFVVDINGPISSDKFQNDVSPIIAKYGYTFCSGMMTDVEALANNFAEFNKENDGVKFGLSCANISAGYYRPHQDSEYIVLEDLVRAIELMFEISHDLNDTYEFQEREFCVLDFNFFIKSDSHYNENFKQAMEEELDAFYFGVGDNYPESEESNDGYLDYRPNKKYLG